MGIIEYGLYNIKDKYFSDFKNNFFVDNKCENRPHYCTFTDKKGTIWFIPLSTQTEPYQKKIEKDAAKIIANDISLRMGAYFHSSLTKRGNPNEF